MSIYIQQTHKIFGNSLFIDIKQTSNKTVMGKWALSAPAGAVMMAM